MYQGIVYRGMETTPDNWQYAQNRLADWLQTLPGQTGIVAVTDFSRARHLLQACGIWIFRCRRGVRDRH